MAYQFYKTAENNRQKPIWTVENVPDEAFHTGVFSLSAMLNGNPSHDAKVRRSGDFVLDIDFKDAENPNAAIFLAIADAKLVKSYLLEHNVPLASLSIFASGSKGFHIIIPMKSFGAIPSKNLPPVYKSIAERVARETGAAGIDFNMFKMGIGQPLRVANKQRANGFYKVQITWDELDDLTPEAYFEKCSSPRELFNPVPVLNPHLSLLFGEATHDVRFEQESDRNTEMETKDFEGLKGAVPACLQRIISAEGLHSEKGGWNAVKMTVARAANSGIVTNADVDEFLKNARSSKYRSVEERRLEYDTAFRIMKSAGRSFGCDYAKATLVNQDVCRGCPVKTACTGKQNHMDLINKVSGAKSHLAKLVKALQDATGKDKTELGHTLCLSLAKTVPAKRSIDDAVSIAERAGVDPVAARDVIDADVILRATSTQTTNKTADQQGLKRMAVNGLNAKGIAELILAEIDLDRYFAGLLGATETIEQSFSKAYEGDNGEIIETGYTTQTVVPVRMQPKVLLLNLPMAAGKTMAATEVHSAIQTKLYEKFLAYRDTLPKRDGNKIKAQDYGMAATVIAHRTSLIKGLANRFNVADYQLVENKREFTGSVATCIDSLPQFNTRNPLLIIDEARQTMSHVVTSETVGSQTAGGRIAAYNSLKSHYEFAGITILMDADLNDQTVNWFKQHGGGREFVLFEMSQDKHPAKHTILTGGHDEARSQILALLGQGKRGVVGCTSHKETLMTAKHIKSKGIKSNRMLVLTGENKGNPRQAAFLLNPTLESENYDVILHSPVIGSGVSIENENLTFSVLMNTCVVASNEALQMLGRNRCATEIFVSFGKPSNYDRVTDAEAFIYADKERIATQIWEGLWDTGHTIDGVNCLEDLIAKTKTHELSKLQAEIHAQRNSDLNDYENNFVLLAELNGRSFGYSGKTQTEFKIKGLRAETILEIAEQRFKAEIVSGEQVEALELIPALTQQQSDALNRFKIVEMTGTDEITVEDVTRHLEGGMSKVVRMELLQKHQSELEAEDAANRKTFNRMGSKVKEQRIFNEVFKVLSDATFADVFENTVLQRSPAITLNRAKALEICKVLKRNYKELSGVADYSKLPQDVVRRANNYLERYGFKAQKSSEKSERNYSVFLDFNYALYVNNRAALRSAQLDTFFV